MKHPRLSAIFVAVSTASLLMVSTAGIAATKKTHHKATATTVAAEHENYKGEANFKAEVPPPCPPIMMLHDGFYVGIGGGYDSYRVHQETNDEFVDLPGGAIALSGTNSLNHSATGWMGGVFAGYGHYFDWFYLGVEINANTSDAETSWNANASDTSAYNVDLEARTSYGIALLPGIKVNDSSLLYVRLGYLRSNFKASETYTNVYFNPNVSISQSDSDWRNGFNYGVGIETYVAENVSVRGEYTHTSYNSDTISQSVQNAAGTSQFNSTSKFEPSNNEFMLSLMYHFA